MRAKTFFVFRLFLMLSLLICASYAQAEWINTAASSAAFAVPQTEITSDGPTGWVVNVSVPGIEYNRVETKDGLKDQIALPNATLNAREGEALLPKFVKFLALSSDGDPEIELLNEEWVELDGTFDLELLMESPQADAIADAYKARDEFLPHRAARLSGREVVGGVPLTVVEINAARYNTARGKVEVLQSCDFRIHENGIAEPQRPITETTAMTLRPMIENWDERGLDEIVVRGSVLYIVVNDAGVIEQVERLQEWHELKGYTTEMAVQGSEITNWTTTGIKSYIQARYNAADPPLESVVLVGDGNGTYTIPAYSMTFEGSEGGGDWDYTRLDGNDLLPDIGLGRLCFGTVNELAIQVTRTLLYEQFPSSPTGGTNPNWYKGGGCFAGSSSSGISTVQVSRTIRARMLDAGYTSSSIDTVYYVNESVTNSKINASLNSGVSLWAFRGYLGMSGYSNGDVASLTNYRRWPFMLNITCSTNDYDDGTDVCEAFMNAGTVANPFGVVAVMGMSSIHTNTRYNNAIITGSAQGVLIEGVTKTGAAHNRGVLEMYQSYPEDSAAGRVQFFFHICNLLGDPTVDVFTDTPGTLFVDNPATAPVGLNTLTLTVTDGVNPVEGAHLQLSKPGEVFIGGKTDANGQITLNFQTASVETLHVVATKHNYAPALNYTLIEATTDYLSPASDTYVIDDDNAGTSSGNANGLAEAGETIELAVPLRNWGSGAVNSIVATLSSSDPYVTSITDNSESYGTIAGGATGNPPDDFDFTLASYIPDGHILQFSLSVSGATLETYASGIGITAANGNFVYVDHTLTGVGDGNLDAGESGGLYLTLDNDGAASTPAATAHLRSLSSSVSVTDSVGSFNAVANGNSGSNSGNTFGVSAAANAIPYEHCTMMAIFPLANGFADTVLFDIVIGSGSSSTPTPPDAYGYWAFDDTDTGYDRTPTFDWVEIDPTQGGDGNVVNIVDEFDEDDMSRSVSLPFTFRYYGQDFTDIAICSNGWLAMGAEQAEHTDFRNYAIPSAPGPSAMIAPFWDDLRVAPARGAIVEDPRDVLIDHAALQAEIERRAISDEIFELEMLQQDAGDEEYDALKQRLIELYARLSPPQVIHERPIGTLDQGSASCTGAPIINSVPTTVNGNVDATDNCTVQTRPYNDVFYEFDVPATGTYEFDMCASSGDLYIRLWLDGTCCSGSSVFDDDGCSGSGVPPYLTQALTSGQTVFIEVGTYYTTDTNIPYTLTITQFTLPGCDNAEVIPSIPATINGSTIGEPAVYTPTCNLGNSPDKFYTYTATSNMTVTASMCLGNTDYDAKLAILENGIEVYCSDDDCSNPPLYNNSWIPRITNVNLVSGNVYCFVVTGYSSNNSGNFTLFIGTPVGRCCYGPDEFNPDCADNMLQGDCNSLGGTWVEGLTCDAFPCPIPPQPDGIFTKHDAANHRFIVQWSRVQKYGGSNPEETFQAILYEPGYPATPTGDGEILFQYLNVTNTTDVSTSNHYATAGIENLDNTDGVLYSYWNEQDPDIPGSAGLHNGRAILFTTNPRLAGDPAAPTNLTVYPSGNDAILRWEPVTEDIFGSPITVDGYSVFGGTTPDVNPTTGTFLGTSPTTSFTDVDAGDRDIYFYVVQAYVNP